MIEARADIARRDSWFGQLYGHGARMATRDDLLRSMDLAGVEKSVVMGFGWKLGDDCTTGNDYIMENAARSEGRLLPFISVVPGNGTGAEFDRWAGNELFGVGELYADGQAFDMADVSTFQSVVDACLNRGLFLCIHISEPAGHEYPGKDGNGPAKVAEFVKHMPSELKLLLPHWGGGFGFYELMPEISGRTSNCFYDCAASHLLYDERVYGLMTQLAPGRVLFGSDFPLTSQRRMLRRVRKAGLDNHDLAAFLGENAVRAGLT